MIQITNGYFFLFIAASLLGVRKDDFEKALTHLTATVDGKKVISLNWVSRSTDDDTPQLIGSAWGQLFYTLGLG